MANSIGSAVRPSQPAHSNKVKVESQMPTDTSVISADSVVSSLDKKYRLSDSSKLLLLKPYTTMAASSTPRCLADHPVELLLKIISFLPRKEYISNLCQTSQADNALIGPLLYREVDFFFNQDRSIYEELSFTVSDLTRFTESLSIFSHWCEDGYMDLWDDDGDASLDLPNLEDLHMYEYGGLPNDGPRYRDLAVGLNRILYQRMSQMGIEKLIKFRWYHRFPIARRTLKLLFDKYAHCLSELRLSEIDAPINCFQEDTDLALDVFECRTIGLSHSADVINPLLKKVIPKLRSLTLGQEQLLYAGCLENGAAHLSLDHNSILAGVDLGSMQTLLLEHLGVIGLKVHPSIRMISILAPSHLRSLHLESCEGYRELWAYFTQNNKSADEAAKFHLTDFRIRTEATTSEDLTAIAEFLGSFSGLRTLSVLMDHTATMPDIECFLSTHATTLKTLVWAGRNAERGSRSSIPEVFLGQFYESDSQICKLFTKCDLESLSINYNWPSHRKYDAPYLGGGFLTMPSLKTLQLRNSPVAGRSTQHTHQTKMFADDFLDYGLGHSNEPSSARNTSNIKALVIGTQSYRQHWRLQHRSEVNREPPMYQAGLVQDRPTIFDITFTKGGFGSRGPMLEQVEFDTVRDLEGFFPAEIMKSIWLQNSYAQYDQ